MWALNLMCFEAPIADKYIMCVIFSKNLDVANFTVVIFEVKNTVNLFKIQSTSLNLVFQIRKNVAHF